MPEMNPILKMHKHLNTRMSDPLLLALKVCCSWTFPDWDWIGNPV